MSWELVMRTFRIILLTGQSLFWFVCFLFVCLFVCFLVFRATSVAYENSQARGQMGAAAACLCHSHRNTWSLTHWARPRIKLASWWILVMFVTHWVATGTPRQFLLLIGVYGPFRLKAILAVVGLISIMSPFSIHCIYFFPPIFLLSLDLIKYFYDSTLPPFLEIWKILLFKFFNG